MATRKRKIPWQVLAIELALITVATLAAYALATRAGAGHATAILLAGIAAGLTLRLVTRHGAGSKRKPARRGGRRAPARRRS